jgi:hypothetical protein
LKFRVDEGGGNGDEEGGAADKEEEAGADGADDRKLIDAVGLLEYLQVTALFPRLSSNGSLLTALF